MKTNAGLLTSVLLLACTLSSFGQPSITLQPTDQTANQGFSATFKVTATTANPPLKYEWSFASNGIPGATTNVFTLINAQPTNAGGYFVVVSDSSGSVTSRTATLTIVLPAALHSKIGPNIPIGGDSAQLSGKHQTEPHLVRSYTDPNLMIATFQDGIGASFRPGAACSYAVSTDGGLSWSRNFIPGLTTVSGGTNVGAADNVAGFDLQGNAYIASLAGTLNYPSQMVICKSTDGGRTFTAPLGLATATSSNFPDKPWLAINTFAHSLTPNRLAVVFSRGPDGDFNGTPFATVSDDTGLTWSAPKRSAPVLVQGQQAFFLPDGTLADLYWHTLSGGSQRIEMILSSDGGETFAAPIVVLDMTGRDYREPTHYGTTTFASAASDRQAGVLYMAIQALISGSPRILFTKSIDKGRTWSTAVAVNDTPADRSVFTPGLAVSADGQHVTIEFYDKRNQTATSANNFVDVYLAESFDGGDTWEPNL